MQELHTSPHPAFKRVFICGAVYADNLGDGIIAECLSDELRRITPTSTVRMLDLSTRRGFGEQAIPNKGILLRLLRRAPSIVARPLLFAGLAYFYFRKARPTWRSLFDKEDLVIIGGGHLLSDYKLNFPFKISTIATFAHRAGAPIVFYGVGVSRNWSKLGKRLLKRALTLSSHIVVRDKASADQLNRHAPELPAASWQPDPGFLARRVYGPADRNGLEGVGLNVSDPTELAAYEAKPIKVDAYEHFWVALIQHYAALGRRISVFTNGASEDEAFLERVQARVADWATGKDIRFVERPRRPKDLVGTVRSLNLLIGHRLHSHIVAFAYGIPSLALGWDSKLQSHLDLMGRSEFLLEFGNPDPKAAVCLAHLAEHRPIEPERRHLLELRATQGIRNILTHSEQRF